MRKDPTTAIVDRLRLEYETGRVDHDDDPPEIGETFARLRDLRAAFRLQAGRARTLLDRLETALADPLAPGAAETLQAARDLEVDGDLSNALDGVLLDVRHTGEAIAAHQDAARAAAPTRAAA